MLIGAHVSVAGGLHKAVERGVETDSDAIQIFSQSPRAWRPTNYGESDFKAFRDAFDASPLRAVVIHAVYLINCASKEPEIRSKSLTALTHSLRVGDAISADGVVLHAGARKGEPHEPSMKRAGEAIREALAESESTPILLENTAGTNGPLGQDFDELAELIELAGGDGRLGVCLDSCHLFAWGFDIRTPEGLAEVVDQFDAKVGLERLRCLHVNDSKIPFGGKRDQHANVGEGEMGEELLSVFLSEPRFEGLPALLETPGPDGKGPDRAEVERTKKLRERGLEARKRG
jgi:deoxyribonuclease-4